MDILHLVDRLEEVFNAGRPIPLTHSLVVDEDRVLELIDQMRVSIPDEVKKAQQVLAQRDRVLAQARAEQILQSAKAEADGIRSDADDYVLDVLTRLETEMTKSLNQVRNGIAKLRVEKDLPVANPGSD